MSEPSSGDDGKAAEELIYGRRFPGSEARRRMELWRVITSHLQRYIPPRSVVLDLGAGSGEFITNVVARERWATDIRDVAASMPVDVRFVRSDGLRLLEVLPSDHFDRVFMSNCLEHLPSGELVIEQLRIVATLLKRGGRAIILQPDISLVGSAYWDFIDHRVALTSRSLTEAVELTGLRPVLTIPRFLPYSTKGKLPTSPFLARVYLALTLAWWLLGKQLLLVAERPYRTP